MRKVDHATSRLAQAASTSPDLLYLTVRAYQRAQVLTPYYLQGKALNRFRLKTQMEGGYTIEPDAPAQIASLQAELAKMAAATAAMQH